MFSSGIQTCICMTPTSGTSWSNPSSKESCNCWPSQYSPRNINMIRRLRLCIITVVLCVLAVTGQSSSYSGDYYNDQGGYDQNYEQEYAQDSLYQDFAARQDAKAAGYVDLLLQEYFMDFSWHTLVGAPVMAELSYCVFLSSTLLTTFDAHISYFPQHIDRLQLFIPRTFVG